MSFSLLSKAGSSAVHRARRGALQTVHGVVQTPFFMPIATKGSVRLLSSDRLAALQQSVDAHSTPIVLSNTYHLFLRPGEQALKRAHGLHEFMQWHGAMLTDSGGFQVFSLEQISERDFDGVTFQSTIDGSRHRLTPERSMEIQHAIGADIWMAFDYFPGYPATREQSEESVAITTEWARRSKARWHELTRSTEATTKHQLFGIVQGSSFPDLRAQSAAELQEIGFDGYAIGGLAVGEPEEVMMEVLDAVTPLLPEDRPRYLMGVGWPEQILEAVKRGVDMFDCVLPTRNARHGQAMIHRVPEIVVGDLERVEYEKINLSTAEYREDDTVLDVHCQCGTCRAGYSRSYIRHLFHIGEPVGAELLTIHNLHFYMQLMKEIRDTLDRTTAE
jgi:queuine tRNA-ribosyltransferase